MGSEELSSTSPLSLLWRAQPEDERVEKDKRIWAQKEQEASQLWDPEPSHTEPFPLSGKPTEKAV